MGRTHKKKRNRKHNNDPGQAVCQRLRMHPKAAAVVDNFRAREVLDALKQTFNLASSLSVETDGCTHFTLLDSETIVEMGVTNIGVQAKWFWREMNLLLVLLTRTSAKALLCSIDGITWALGSRNELLLALSTRALLEHAASLAYLERSVSAISERLRTVVWPCCRSGGSALTVRDADSHVHETLLRFAVGRVVEVRQEDIPSIKDSSESWQAFVKGMRNVPARLKAVPIKDMRQVLVDKTGSYILNPIYQLLSEFCHPNSASRTLDFDVQADSRGKHLLTVPSASESSAGFERIMGLCRLTIPVVCRAADEGLKVLADGRMPMTTKAAGETQPFAFSQRVVDSHGRVSWVHASQIFHAPPAFKVTLTPEQRGRVHIIQEKFRRGCRDPVEKWLDDLACEGHNVENEIATWEHLASVFQQELRDRGAISDEECELLYTAVVESSKVSTAHDLLRVLPGFRILPQLDRVVARVCGNG